MADRRIEAIVYTNPGGVTLRTGGSEAPAELRGYERVREVHAWAVGGSVHDVTAFLASGALEEEREKHKEIVGCLNRRTSVLEKRLSALYPPELVRLLAERFEYHELAFVAPDLAELVRVRSLEVSS